MNGKSIIKLAAGAIIASGVTLLSPIAWAQSAHHGGMAGHAPVRARPATLDISLNRQTEQGLYRIRVQSLEQPVPLNRIHSWSVTVERDGKPVEGAKIAVDGGMPEHGHGYPTTPRVEIDPAGGYQIRGMKFSMRGWWELKLMIDGPAGEDQVTFNMVL